MRFVMDARYAGPKTSGIGSYVRAIASRLPGLAPASAFHFWIRPGTEPLSQRANVTHSTVLAPAAGLFTLLFPSLLGSLSSDDVFHAPANILGFGLPCRSIVTVHDVMWLDHLEWCQPRPWLRPISGTYYSLGIRRALRLADRILTVSAASRDAILRIEPQARSRIHVAPNAYEPHFRAPDSRDAAAAQAAQCLGSDAPFFLVVGQNQPSKAHAVAIEAFAAANLASHRLVLVQRLEVGRGLDSLVKRLGISSKVAFLPDLPLPSLIALLQSATALLQPSLAEGFGLPALEAMACGCPVIASDIPPLREVLGNAGVFVPPGCVAPLARALEQAIRDPGAFEERRARGLERARAFSWDKSAQITLEVYESVARGERAHAA